MPGIPADNYWFRRHEAAYRFASSSLVGRTLDVGCGEGYGASMLVGPGRTVVAVELDPATASHAAVRYPDLRLFRGDACRLPFRPASFDGIAAMQVLEHLWCPEEFLSRTRDLLPPGGVLVLSTPNRITFSPEGTMNPFHTHEYTAEDVASLVGRFFEHVELLGVHPGIYLRSLDVLAAGSLQHLLMRTAFEDLPSKLSIGTRMVRAGHFRIGPAEGSLDLLAVAS